MIDQTHITSISSRGVSSALVNSYGQGGDVDEQLEYDKDAWDEGGKSDCGYSDSVHETLMSIGETIYSVLGEPSEEMRKRMKGIGSYFMEMSYAVRDIQRGDWNVIDDASEPEFNA
ncbi:hypothetical protein HJC23_009932 [Cyclotella cryptica]|uniref:Uncharacterized protein n=1 Tax=Cyclotella cryptica TaxID=29204 RepID=A0ABD3P0C1_9STRA|eukprot:CCRYP_018793-RA/>CCRYP_018793-RA protein AED:0.06 eAED:-0.07 QI:0/-1/0/1/-1/1/1/0/115